METQDKAGGVGAPDNTGKPARDNSHTEANGPVRPDETRLVWVDMEMTGLHPDIDRIIEVAMIVTDSELNVLAEGPVLAIHQPDAVLEAMDKWNQSTHGKSGLIDRVKASTITEAAAQRMLLDFMRTWVRPARRRCAAIPLVRTGASWPATCRSWRNTSCTATWM